MLALQAVLVLLGVLGEADFEIGTFDKPTLRALATVQTESKDDNLRAELSHDGTLGPHTLAFLNDTAQKLVGGVPAQLRTVEREASSIHRRQEADLQYLKELVRMGESTLRCSIVFDTMRNRYAIRLGWAEAFRIHLFHIALALLGHLKIEDLVPNLQPNFQMISRDTLSTKLLSFSSFSKQALLDFQHRYAPRVNTEDFGTRVCDGTWDAVAQQLARKWGLQWNQGQRAAPKPAAHPITESLSHSLERGVESARAAQAFMRWRISRRMALSTLFGAGAAVGVAGAAGVGWLFRDALRATLVGETAEGEDEATLDTNELRQTEDLMQRRVDRLELPDDLTDTEVLLWAAAPIYDGQTQLSYDTVLSSFALSRHLFKSKFLLKNIGDGSEDDRGARQERMYSFMIPGTESGELLDYDEGQNTLNEVSWAHALNLLTRAPHATDNEVQAFLIGWYETTFVNQDGIPLRLDPSHLTVHRFENGWIKSVSYSGSNAEDSLKFNKFVQKPGTPQTGSIPGRTYQKVPKQLTKNGRLLVWTGVNQPLVIPQSFLATEGTATLEINGSTSASFTWKELADSIRAYFSARNDHARGWSRFVQYNNPIIQRLAQNVMGGKTGLVGLESLRIFGQKIPYEWESAGVEVNRPAIATLLQAYQESGGDCNNRAVALASLFKAGGYRTAIIEVAPTSEQRERLRRAGDENAFYRHLLVAVHLSHFKDSPDYSWYTANAYSDPEHPTDRWVLVETGRDWEFGSQLPDGYFIEEIEEIEEIR